MRIRRIGSRFVFSFLLFACALLPAHATSFGKSVAPTLTACAVTAKFISTKLDAGKIFWVFDRIGENTDARCANLGSTFEVFIPAGSYSKNEKANIYPHSISEPKTGEEIDLRLESILFKTGQVRWLVSDGADAYRIRRE